MLPERRSDYPTGAQDRAEGRMEMVEKDRSRRRLSSRWIVAQERDAIARPGVAA